MASRYDNSGVALRQAVAKREPGAMARAELFRELGELLSLAVNASNDGGRATMQRAKSAAAEYRAGGGDARVASLESEIKRRGEWNAWLSTRRSVSFWMGVVQPALQTAAIAAGVAAVGIGAGALASGSLTLTTGAATLGEAASAIGSAAAEKAAVAGTVSALSGGSFKEGAQAGIVEGIAGSAGQYLPGVNYEGPGFTFPEKQGGNNMAFADDLNKLSKKIADTKAAAQNLKTSIKGGGNPDVTPAPVASMPSIGEVPGWVWGLGAALLAGIAWKLAK